MRIFRLNKLVRDKIFENMLEKGQQVEYHELKGEELLRAAYQKLAEEVEELTTSDEPLKELADIQAAVHFVTKLLGLTPEMVEAHELELQRQSGGFERGIFIETISLDDNDRWVPYYTSDADRFPEINQ